jgi:hypothetical protein
MVALQNENNMRCAKVVPEEISTDIYYDDKRLMVDTTTIYTAFIKTLITLFERITGLI